MFILNLIPIYCGNFLNRATQQRFSYIFKDDLIYKVMRKRGNIYLACLVFLMFLILNMAIVNAEYKYYNHSMQKSYRAGEVIKGKVNMSFDNEGADSIVKSNFGNISLLDWLLKNKFQIGKEFSCNNAKCTKEYKVQGAATSFEFENEKIIGARINGEKIEKIEQLSFNISSDVAGSCNMPLVIDFLGNGTNLIATRNYTKNVCGINNYGCFNTGLESGAYREAIITGDEICENISLRSGPAFSIGAKVKKEKNVGKLEIVLRDYNYFSLGKCNLPTDTQNQNEENLECIVEYSSMEENNYFVCINGEHSGNVEYKIRSETKEPKCGTDNTDFEIFAKPLEYGRTNFSIDKSVFEKFSEENLEEYIFNYLIKQYTNGTTKSVKCDPYCIIPIKLTGNKQKVNVHDVKLTFYDGSRLYEAPKEFYSLALSPVVISSNPIEIDIGAAGFKIPIGAQDSLFELYLNDKDVFPEKISIEKSFDFDINTKFAFLGLETRFEVVGGFNITSSQWDFGDGTKEDVKGKSIAHRYTKAGEFNMVVELKRADGIGSSKTFKIVVGNAKESGNKTLVEYNKRFTNITKEIEKFSDFERAKIKELMEFDKMKESLRKLESRYGNASSDKDFEEVVKGLLELDVPYSVSVSKEGKLPLAVGFDNIDVKYVEEISEEKSKKEKELKDIIAAWSNSYFDADIELKVISAFSDSEKKDILTHFVIETKEKKKNNTANVYLFIDKPFSSLIFEGNYSQKPVGEGAGIVIPLDKENDKENVISFIIKGEIEASELGAYISPVIDELGIDKKPECPEDEPECIVKFPTGKLIFVLAGLFVAVLVIYIILQEWYKRHYENHLFRNKDDLYNLINFFYNSRVAGLTDSEIWRKLKDSGWNGERINYATRKLDGKRTGMWEIPIFKGTENRRVREEIERRQGTPIDSRFYGVRRY